MDLEQLLRAAFVLRAPKADFEDAVMARVSAARQSVARGGASRRILVGTVLVVAAAASMLVVQLTRAPALKVATTTPAATVVPEPVETVEPTVLAAMNDPVAAKKPPTTLVVAEPQPAGTNAAAMEAPAAVKPFIVRMQPLQNQATQVDARAAIDLYYTSLLAGLRAIPGLTLIESETPTPNVNVPGVYRIAVVGSAPQPGKVSLQTMEGAMDSPDGRSMGGARMAISMLGDVVPSCVNSPANNPERISCNDPASVAARVVDMLRTRIFPPDPALRQYLQARLVDARLDPNQRLKALTDLAVFKERGDAAPTAKLDDAAVRGAIDLAAKSPDPLVRAQVWLAMRGVRHADLLQPLMSAARDDADGDVRLQAVVALAANFAEDDRARAALQTIAREDSRPLVRALAQRGLSGDGAWKDYVVSSLKDTNRPIAERMEGFMYHMYKPSPGGGMTMSMDSRKILDDEVIQALGKVLPQAMQLPEVKRAQGQLLGDLAQVNTAAADGLLSDLLDKSADARLRSTIVTRLARRASEPRVRSILQKASSDNDPQVRQAATQALSGATPASNGPQLLGF